MKKLLLLLATASCLLPARAAETAWQTNFTQAVAMAKAQNKAVLVNFTGSDWCGFCVKLHKQVFDTPQFAEYAKKNLVLVEADFPRRKKLAPAQAQANEALKAKYAPKFEGYPTIMLVDGNGKKLGEEVGYGGDSPAEYIAKLEKIRTGK